MAAACGGCFTVVVVEKGNLRSFGKGFWSARARDARRPGAAGVVGGAHVVFDGESVVIMACGDNHTACVTAKGTLWTWGNAQFGQLGHGDREPRQRTARVGKEMYGGSPAVMVSCGGRHMLVLTAVDKL